MEFEIYFFTQICIHNNFSKWKICKSFNVTSNYMQKLHMDFFNLEEHGSLFTTLFFECTRNICQRF